jgi:hypothetical protein
VTVAGCEGIVAKLNAAMVKSLSEPAVRAKFAELGLDIVSRDQQAPDYLAKLCGDEIESGGRSLRRPTCRHSSWHLSRQTISLTSGAAWSAYLTDSPLQRTCRFGLGSSRGIGDALD